MRLLLHVGSAILLLAALGIACPAAQAWQNGPSTRPFGRTTVQQWILKQAVARAERVGCDWVDLGRALKTVPFPDTVAHDSRYQMYERWGGQRAGAAPTRVAVYFALVSDALKAGDKTAASAALGMMTNYYTDASDPLHTAQSRAERRMHRAFELRVMASLNHGGAFRRQLREALRAAAARQSVDLAAKASEAAGNDVASFTARSAKRAHRSYRRLVRGYLRHGFSQTPRRIAAKTIKRSVAGLATLIEAAAQSATGAQKSPSSTQPVSGGCACTASSQDALFHPARFATDGDLKSYWSATVSGYPQWWQVDLGATCDLSKVVTKWVKGTSRSYRYDIRVSTDGASWRSVVDQSARTSFGNTTDTLTGVNARYVRIDVLGYGVSTKTRKDSDSAAKAAISECRVYAATTTAPDPTPLTTPTPTPSVTPTKSPTPTPSQGTVLVPSGASRSQIDACMAKAVADGAGTILEFPSGVFPYDGVFMVPDGITVRGQGIWDQGRSDGGGGTWLQCSRGMSWGSDCVVEDLLVGKNTAGVTCSFHPVARGSSAAGQSTYANGSHNCRFSYVRFKGGSDSGAGLIDLGSNFGSGLWSGPVRTYDMIDTQWDDCEFERPQGTSGGADLNIWLDCRAGGAQVYGNSWNRCHFGVKNGYHSGVQGYGVGTTIIFQPAPAEHASDGPRPSSGSNLVGDSTNGWNPTFNWSQVNHGFSDNSFRDCLFEYATWVPMDVCGYARSYSVWQGNHTGLPGTLTTALTASANSATGWGNPPQGNWTKIPNRMWNVALSMTRCYSKGSYPTAHGVIGEIGKDCTITDCYCGTGSTFNQAGRFGNVATGAFSNGDRPVTSIFPSGSAYDWTGNATAYTPSPYDP